MIQATLASRGLTEDEKDQARDGVLVLGKIIDDFGDGIEQPKFHICLPVAHECGMVCEYCGDGGDVIHFVIRMSEGVMDVVCVECLDSDESTYSWIEA